LISGIQDIFFDTICERDTKDVFRLTCPQRFR
jgi:hypothetical protein